MFAKSFGEILEKVGENQQEKYCKLKILQIKIGKIFVR